MGTSIDGSIFKELFYQLWSLPIAFAMEKMLCKLISAHPLGPSLFHVLSSPVERKYLKHSTPLTERF
jgi:hypothetical protein